MFQKHRGKSRNQLRHWELVRFTFLIGHVSVQSPRHFFSGQMDVNASSSKNKVRSFESYEFVSCSWDWWFQKGGLDKADKCSWWLLRRESKKWGGGCVYQKQVPWQLVGANSSLKAPWKHRVLMDLGGNRMVSWARDGRYPGKSEMIYIMYRNGTCFQWGNWSKQVDKSRIWMSRDEHREVVPWRSANFRVKIDVEQEDTQRVRRKWDWIFIVHQLPDEQFPS